MSTFTGFPVAALDFYDDLEVDNTRSFWEKHKDDLRWSRSRQPMTALCEALAPEFAPDGQSAKVFRPYRDVRFAKDKTPYKTHQGAFVAAGPATGWYVEISARGLRVGAGFYEASGERLARIREAMADDKSGPRLQRVLRKLEKDGFEISGERLKTSPRGYDADHPRIDAAPPQAAVRREVLRLRGPRLPRRARPGPDRLAGAAPAGRVGGTRTRSFRAHPFRYVAIARSGSQ